MRVLNAPNGQEIKLNVQRFCHLVPTDITLVMLKFGCQPQVRSKWLKVLWSCRKWGKKAQCAMWQMWVLGNLNFKAYYAGRYSKHCGHTEYSENLLDQYYKHYEHVCSCFPDAKPQEYQSLEKASLYREICLYQLTLVPTKKAKDERNISAQNMYTKPKNGNLTNLHLHFPGFHTIGNVWLTQNVGQLFARLFLSNVWSVMLCSRGQICWFLKPGLKVSSSLLSCPQRKYCACRTKANAVFGDVPFSLIRLLVFLHLS